MGGCASSREDEEEQARAAKKGGPNHEKKIERRHDDGDDDDGEPGAAAEHVRWMQKLRKKKGSKDVSEDFHALHADIRAGKHELQKRWDLLYFIIPGLFCNTYPIYMDGVIAHFKELGLDCRKAKIDTGAEVQANAKVIAEEAVKLAEQTGKRVLLIGHSKGGCDSVAALSRHTKDLKGKVAGIVCLQSPLGGTPIANDLLGSKIGGLCKRVIEWILRGDVDALGDLTYEKRRQELEEFPFPHEHFPIVTFSTGTERISSSMAACSAFFRSKYDGLITDGMVASADADLPDSMRVFFKEDFDHGGCAFPEPGDTASAPHVDEAVVALLVRSIAKDVRPSSGGGSLW